MSNSCLVIGGNLQGIKVALDLAETGQQVHLLEEEPSIGTDVNCAGDKLPEGVSHQDVIPMLLRAISHPRIKVLTCARLVDLKGREGNFKARVSQLPTYVREELCKGCGICIDACPVTLNSNHGIGHTERKAVDFHSLFSVPFVPNITKQRRAPCVETCPAHINIQGYVALVSMGKFKEAYDLIRETIPFPSVCGRVCFHPCEDQCNRDKVDEPLAINNIKRFVTEYVHNEGLLESPKPLKPKGPKVAIIGSGPAGLTAAHDLIKLGYRPTVFESLKVPGGMLRVGIVSYRLPEKVLDREINDLKKLGVEIKTGIRIGKDLTIKKLFSRGFKAVFIATGAHGARMLNIEGEDLKGVVDGVKFLREVNLKGKFKLNKNTIVIGGGNVALDCARAALRVGAKKVKVVCLESKKEMPAHSWEIQEALDEGIILMPSLGPKRIIGKNGHVKGLETLKVKHVFDKEGRFNPAFHAGTEDYIGGGDSMIVAIGQYSEKDSFEKVDGIELSDRGHLKLDEKTLMTTRPGVFAGGDLATGPLSVIDAIAAGKRVALSIDKYIRKDKTELPEWTAMRGEGDSEFVVPDGIKKAKRQKAEHLSAKIRVKGFDEVEGTFNSDMAVKEATRCLNCGLCSECMECVRVCEILNAVEHDLGLEETEIKADNVVVALDGNGGMKQDIKSILDLKLDKKGQPIQPKFGQGSLESSRTGIYLTTMNSGAKDYYQQMIAASSVSSELAEGTGWSKEECLEKQEAPGVLEKPSRIGTFVCHCGGGISNYVDVENVAGQLGEMDSVTFHGTVDYACSSDGIDEMKSLIEKNGLDAIVLAACSCCSLEQICSNCSHQRVRQKDEIFRNLGLDRKKVELVNIREHCAWTHSDNQEFATDKAFRVAASGVQGLLGNNLLGESGEKREIGKKVIVIGSGSIALSCAGTLNSLGFEAVLLKTGKPVSSGKKDLAKKWGLPVVNLVDNANVSGINGAIGLFTVDFSVKGSEDNISGDFVVLADSSKSATDKLGEVMRFSALEPFRGRRRGFFQVTGIKKKSEVWETVVGRALAMQVLVERGSGVLEEISWAPHVDQFWCRGCGTCVEVCPFDACRMVELDRSVNVSEVDTLACQGCELCVLNCPTGAMRSGYFNEKNIDRLLEAILDDREDKEDKKVVVFACHWCHYGGTDIKERGQSAYPPGVKIVRLTCTGRIGPNFILKAFQHGADGVMVMGCPEEDCHYADGSRRYREKESVVTDLISSMGIASSRYRTLWTSPGDGEEFNSTVEEFVKGLGRGESE
jgi:NADPH-dependent glutamate synthase beta subunit-like oxidoreductase/Pyruvate/2-oxoacid:ferredoxin oxidoreductase delta subunit